LHQLPWGKLPRLTPLSRRPSRWGKLLARPWPQAHQTGCRRWRRLLPVAVLAVEPPVAADAEMVVASLLGALEEGGARNRDPSR
jgi:hypothetical protein